MVNTDNQIRQQCLLHWEITNKCNLACKFCYRGRDIPPRDLPYDACLKILDSFIGFLQNNNFIGSIIFSGGDPLLRDDFLDILRMASAFLEKGIINRISISGNPDRIDKNVAGELKSSGICIYQFSIDGLEKTHDWFRKNGSFRETLSAIRCLNKAGIRTSVKFTLSRLNLPELAGTMKLLINEGVVRFSFTQLVPVGDGKNLRHEVLTPSEFRQALIDVIYFLDSLPPQYTGLKIALISNEPLYGLLFHELGRWAEYERIMALPQNLTACGKGLAFSVLPDGEVRARRFIPVKAGRVPEQSFDEIYRSSELVKLLEDENYTRKRKQYPKCRNCIIVERCGYMVADSYHETSDPCSPNPKCWLK